MTLLTNTSITWPEQGEWTYADWEKLPNDGRKYEVIDGTLHTSPSPTSTHQYALMRLAGSLMVWADQTNSGSVFPAPMDVLLPNQPVPFQPDVIFVKREHEEIIQSQRIVGVPDFVAEVLSPSNWLYDRREKMEIYETAGIPEYWIIDPRAREIELYLLEDSGYLLINKVSGEQVARSQTLAQFEVKVNTIFLKTAA